jgi:hypothetical protein
MSPATIISTWAKDRMKVSLGSRARKPVRPVRNESHFRFGDESTANEYLIIQEYRKLDAPKGARPDLTERDEG